MRATKRLYQTEEKKFEPQKNCNIYKQLFVKQFGRKTIKNKKIAWNAALVETKRREQNNKNDKNDNTKTRIKIILWDFKLIRKIIKQYQKSNNPIGLITNSLIQFYQICRCWSLFRFILYFLGMIFYNIWTRLGQSGKLHLILPNSSKIHPYLCDFELIRNCFAISNSIDNIVPIITESIQFY